MLNSMGLEFVFKAVDHSSHVMHGVAANMNALEKAAGQTISGLSQKIDALGTGLVTGFAGAGGLAASLNLSKAAGDVEFGLAKVDVVAHATADEIARMEKFALNAAKAIGLKPTEAIAGMHALGQQGYGVNRILEMMTPLMKFAQAGEMDMADAADLSAQAMRAFSIEAEFFPYALDQMQGAADMFSMSTKDLVIGLSRSMSGARLFRATLTDTLGLFGLFKDVLASTQVSGTAVSYMFQGLANTKNHAKIKSALGVDIMDKATGQYRDIVDVLGEMLPKLSKMGEGQQVTFLEDIFGHEAVKGVQAMMARLETGIEDSSHKLHKGAEGLRYVVTWLAQQNGTLDAASGKLINNFNGSMKVFDASFESLKSKLGKPFKNVWRDILEDLNVRLDHLGSALERANPKTLEFFAKITTAASGILLLAGSLGTLKAAIPLIGAGFKLLGAIFAKEALVGAIAWWPLLAVLAAVGMVVYAVQNNLGGLGDMWAKLTTSLSGSDAVVENTSNILLEFWKGLKTGFAWAMEAMSPVFTLIGESFKFIADAVKEWQKASAGLSIIQKTFHWVGKVIGGVLTVVATVILGVVGAVLMLITTLARFFIFLYDVGGKVFRWLGDKFSWLADLLGFGGKKNWGFDSKNLQRLSKVGVQHEVNVTHDGSAVSTAPLMSTDPAVLSSRPEFQTQSVLSSFDPAQFPAAMTALAQQSNYHEGIVSGTPDKNFSVDELATALSSRPVLVQVDGKTIMTAYDKAKNQSRAYESR